jgi:hypothetical protein
VLNICSGFIGGSVQVGYNLGRPEQFVQMDLHMAQVQGGKPKFGGGLGAVRTGIALFCATKAIPCTVCKSRKAT